MSGSEPMQDPPEGGGATAEGGGAASPSLEPPASSGGGLSGGGDSAPALDPSGGATAGAGGGDGGVTAWVNTKKVSSLWAPAQNRNSWAGIAGVGWKKLANNSDTAVVALTILAGSAKVTQGDVNYREEADGMIHEIYAW
jgi:hypothetical protein